MRVVIKESIITNFHSLKVGECFMFSESSPVPYMKIAPTDNGAGSLQLMDAVNLKTGFAHSVVPDSSVVRREDIIVTMES